MSPPDEYELVVTPPAARAISDHLPEPVAAAVIEFLTTALVRELLRVVKPLRRELSGTWSALRGTYGSGGAHAYGKLTEPLPATTVVQETGELVEPIEAGDTGDRLLSADLRVRP